MSAIPNWGRSAITGGTSGVGSGMRRVIWMTVTVLSSLLLQACSMLPVKTEVIEIPATPCPIPAELRIQRSVPELPADPRWIDVQVRATRLAEELANSNADKRTAIKKLEACGE